jgi:hypothetical protein
LIGDGLVFHRFLRGLTFNAGARESALFIIADGRAYEDSYQTGSENKWRCPPKGSPAGARFCSRDRNHAELISPLLRRQNAGSQAAAECWLALGRSFPFILGRRVVRG